LLANPDLARRFGKAARQKVVAEFQVSIVNERTLCKYSALLSLPARQVQVQVSA
jgi:hypothetical protein